MVAPPSGEDRVSIPIGAVYDKASTDAAAAQFEADVQELVNSIQGMLKDKQGSLGALRGIEQVKQILTPEALGIDPKVVEEAFNRIEGGAKKAAPAVKEVSKEFDILGDASADTLSNGASKIETFQAKVVTLKEAVRGISTATGAGFETIGKALTPLMAGEDKSAFSAAIKQLIVDEKAAASAAEEMKTRTVNAINGITPTAENLRAKVDQMKEVIRSATKETGYDPSFLQKAVLPEISPPDRSAFKQAIQEVKAEYKALEDATKTTSTLTVAEFSRQGGAITEYRAKVEQMKAAIIDLAKSTGASYGDIQKVLSPQVSTLDRGPLNQAFNEIKTGLRETGTEKDKFKGNVSQLGTTLQFVFGAILGISAVGAIRSFIGYLKEAVAMGAEYITTLFRMSVAVRALQRGGLDISLEEVAKQIENLNKSFPQFSKISLTQGVTNAMLFTANLKMTKDQINEMIKSSMTLAAVMGRDVNEVMRTMALTLSSGYSEGLQRLGININKVVITEKAHAMGIKEGYQAMTQYQRATAALALITEQTAKMQEDATKFQETASGRLAVANATLTNTTTDLGKTVLPFWSKLVYQFSEMVAWLNVLVNAAMKGLEILATGYLAFTAILQSIATSGFKSMASGMNLWDSFRENVKVGLAQARKEVDELFRPEQAANLGNAAIGGILQGFTEEEQQRIIDATEGLQEKLAEIEREGAEKRLELADDYARDLQNISLKLQRDLEDAEREHQRNLIELDVKAARDREDAARDLANNLYEDAIKYEEDIAEAKRKRQEQTLDDAADFQRKLKRMQDELSFNLEEAIGSRDIKSAYRILRRYKLDYGQAQEDYENQQRERDVAFKRELAQLERQRVIRAAQRQREYVQRLQDIARRAEQDRIDEEIRYQREQIDLKARAEQERADRLEKYKQQLVDLEKSQADQYRKLAESMVKQYNLSKEMLKAVYETYKLYYGPDGAMDKLYQYMINSAARAAMLRDRALAGRGGGKLQQDKEETESVLPGGYAEGGSFIASSRMTATFGEKGPELVNVRPLSYIGRNAGKLFGSLPGGAGGASGPNRIQLDILLSRDLEARVVSQALDQMSDLMVRVERER